ncbi:hypothetical protein N9242_03075 [Vicingaceae bacterium]|nr:hypothetical protein [Vicingaceae bacterium]
MANKSNLTILLRGLMVVCVMACGCSDKSATKSADDSGSDKSRTNKKTPANDTEKKATTNKEKDKTDVKAEPISGEKFPRPDNAEKPMYTADTNTVLFHQVGSVADQAKYYEEQLGKLEWEKKDSSEIVDGVGYMDFTKGSLKITITINPRDDKITTIAQGSGIIVSEELEQESMDDED